MHLSVAEARSLGEAILERHGFGADDARLITDVLVEAHLWGRPDSGLGHLRHVVEAGEREEIRIVHETDRSVLLDGGNSPGFLVSSRAMLLAIEKAKSGGIAIAAASNAFLGSINGYYVSMAAREGLIGVMTTSSGRRVAPAGSIDALFGTNPIAVAVPTQDEPIVLDMSTALSNVGGLRRAARLGERIAPGIAIGPDGEPTQDPDLGLEGAILPFGGHKGSGLAMIVQCLGLLGGGPVIPEGMGGFGYFFLVFDPEIVMPAGDYRARTSELVERVRAGRPVSGSEAPRVPGERAFALRKRLLKDGIDLDEPLYHELCELLDADRTG